MKNIFLFIFIFMSYNSINAQTNYEDVVYLKNGSIIHGIIIEQIPNESIKIKSGQNIFVYKISEVQKMTKEEVTSPSANPNNTSSQTITYDWKSMEIYLKNKLETESAGALQYLDFKKTDGASKVVDGQNWYTLYFTFTFQPTINVWKNGNSGITSFAAGGFWTDFKVWTKELTGWDAHLAMDQKLYKANQPIRLTGRSELYKTETGWKISKLTFNRQELLSASEASQMEKEKVAAINSTLNNSSSSNPYNQIEKRTYFVNNLPNFKNATIELSKIESLSTNFNVSEVQDIIIKAFENSSRFESNTSDKSVNNFSYEFTITSLNYTFDQGKKAVSNEPYAGYSCKLLLKYKLVNKTNNSTVYEETLTFEGGDPKLDTDKSNAYNLCLKRLSKTISNLILFYSPVLSNFESVESSDKKGFPKFIYLDNSKYFSTDMNIFFVIVEESNIYYKGGKLTYSNAIATCDLKGINDNKLKCKILSGEEKLKSYIDNGKKIVAVSSIIKPEKVE